MTQPISVAVNLTWLAPGRVGGSEEYLVRQLSALPANGSIVPTIYCQRAFVDAYPDLVERWTVVPMPLRRDHRSPQPSATPWSWCGFQNARGYFATNV